MANQNLSQQSAPQAPTQQTKLKRAVPSVRDRINNWNVPKPIAVGLIVVLLAFAGWSVYSFLPLTVSSKISDGAPQPDTPDKAWLRDKIKETGGNFSRLSAADRDKANAITRPLNGMSADAVFDNPNALEPPSYSDRQMAIYNASRAAQKR